MVVLNIRQSLFMMVAVTSSWMDRGVVFQVSFRRFSFSFSLQVKFSVCLRVSMSRIMAKNCWWFSYFFCFFSISMKWWSKYDCIIIQSTVFGRLMFVVRKTMFFFWRVVMFLWACMRWDITVFREFCYLQEVLG